jgi:alanine racemase
VNTPEEVGAIAQYHLEPNLSTPEQAKLFSATLTNSRTNSSKVGWALPTPLKTDTLKSFPVHINIDTGMSRLGMPWQEARELVQLVQSLPGLELTSIYSHLATAEDIDSPVRQLQHDRFQKVIDSCKVLGLPAHVKFHLANSAGTLIDQGLHYDRVRVGLSLYGLYPAPHLQSLLSLQPVMTVKARITLVKSLAAGTGVSYGYRFTAPQDMLIAVVGIGYGDGVPRLLSNKMKVLIRGRFVPQIGSITMDQLMLDVSAMTDLQPGEIVTLLGQDGDRVITADDWAEAIDTISWEILCGFKSRLPRVISEQ